MRNLNVWRVVSTLLRCWKPKILGCVRWSTLTASYGYYLKSEGQPQRFLAYHKNIMSLQIFDAQPQNSLRNHKDFLNHVNLNVIYYILYQTTNIWRSTTKFTTQPHNALKQSSSFPAKPTEYYGQQKYYLLNQKVFYIATKLLRSTTKFSDQSYRSSEIKQTIFNQGQTFGVQPKTWWQVFYPTICIRSNRKFTTQPQNFEGQPLNFILNTTFLMINNQSWTQTQISEEFWPNYWSSWDQSHNFHKITKA